MSQLFLLLKIVFFITLTIIILNFGIYFRSYYFEKKKQKLQKSYEKIILKYLFEEENRVKIIKEMRKNRISIVLFVEKVVEIMNIINGTMRKDLIYLCDSLDISNLLVKKLRHPFVNKVEKELLLYQIGELRSKRQFNYFLNIDRAYIKKHDLYKGYFFAINNIANEWINELEDTEVNLYVDLVFIIIEESKASYTLNTKKLFEIFLTDTSNLFKYIISHDNTRRHMINSLITKEIPLASKGEVLFIMVLNFEYRINNFIKKEFSKYIEKDTLSPDELNYLIFLIKALGEMGLPDGYNSFKKACSSKNWTIKAIAAKYLYKFDEKETYQFLEKFLHDSVWWVRNNAAQSLDKMGLEGIKILLQTLKSEDRFAKEVSSYILAAGSYYSYLREDLTKNSSLIEGLYELITSPSGLVIIDRIITDKKISSTKKMEIIDIIDFENHKAYLHNLTARKSIEFEIRQYVEAKLKHSFGGTYEGND